MTNSSGNPDFPLPPDLDGYWSWDKIHAPHTLTPLCDDLLIEPVSAGFTDAMLEYSSPYGMRFRTFNYYLYGGGHPFDLPEGERERRAQEYQRRIEAVLDRIGERWDNEWLPSILPGLERARNFDYAPLSDDELWRVAGELIAG